MSFSSESTPRLSRRDVLKNLARVGMASLPALPGGLASSAFHSREWIKKENEKAGTTDWMLEKTRVDPKTR